MSDHNLTLVARKLTRKRFNFNKQTCTNVFHCVPKDEKVVFETEINYINWIDIIDSEDLGKCCKIFADKINSIKENFSVNVQRKSKRKPNLPWMNEIVWR